MTTFEITDEQRFELKLLFLEELRQGYEEARDAQQRLLKLGGSKADLETIHRLFHKIAGTAASVELPLLGHLAAMGEETCEVALEAPARVHAKLRTVISEGLTAMTVVLDEHGSGRSEPDIGPGSPAVSEVAAPIGAEGQESGLSKILVIDDDPVSAQMIDNYLRQAGFSSSFTSDPHEALARIEQELPDLLVMDVVMPEIDGFELCRRVRSHPAQQFVPIIFVTRKGDVEQRVRGLEVGGNDYIAKPFEPRELVARVRSHLARLASLREMAVRDSLTRCYNHRFFKSRLDQELERSQRYEDALAIAMLDIDHFKNVNDSYGHMVGDAVLVHMANLVMATVRSTDVVARYGGEEFALLMARASTKEAQLIAERIRARVANEQFPVPENLGGDARSIPITVSIGVAVLDVGSDTMSRLIERADAALYEAKEAGRNRVCTAEPPSSHSVPA